MHKTACNFNLVYCSCVFSFWLMLTSVNHPTWTLRVVCTSILVGASVVYSVLLCPTRTGVREFSLGILRLLGCGFLAAAAIHMVYNQQVGPDPRRFTFLSNVLMDTEFVLVNTLAAIAAAWFARQIVGRSLRRLRRVE